VNNKHPDLKPLLIAQMIGDSFLLPYENLNKKLAQKRFAKYHFKQSLCFGLGYGMTSDDTDHMLMTAQALLEHDDVDAFQKSLARKLKWWLMTFPAGIGKATLQSVMRLWLGVSPKHSGIRSSGNGPLMRVPVIAQFYSGNDEIDANKRHEFIKASTIITHKNNDTVVATQGMGNFIAWISQNKRLPDKTELGQILWNTPIKDDTWTRYVTILTRHIDLPLNDFIEKLGCKTNHGVSGYIMHTAPFVIYVLYHLKHIHSLSYQDAFALIIQAGGDTDTIGAIVSACLGVLEPQEFNAQITQLFPKVNLEDLENHLIYSHFWSRLWLKNLIAFPVIVIHVFIRLGLSVSLLWNFK
jgi:ADP-ribosyl-[dinitrogen reductase] hydrolase